MMECGGVTRGGILDIPGIMVRGGAWWMALRPTVEPEVAGSNPVRHPLRSPTDIWKMKPHHSIGGVSSSVCSQECSHIATVADATRQAPVPSRQQPLGTPLGRCATGA